VHPRHAPAAITLAELPANAVSVSVADASTLQIDQVAIFEAIDEDLQLTQPAGAP
jgi:hypothetical protein